MVKIITKKKMTLPEIIQWGWDNGIKNEEFMASLGGRIYFDEDSWIDIEEDNLISPEETFEVEVEEEITEETKIHNLVEVYRASSGVLKLAILFGTNIKNANTDETIAFYMLNDDYTMSLLWKDGEMIDEN